MSTDEMLAAILKLPRPERARVAEALLSSLEEPEEAVEAAWVEELLRRSRAVTEGKVQPIPLETVRSQFQRELEERRARRSSS